jgi:hypothetical protein
MTTWRKSSHSDETGGHCVEVAHLSDAIGIRDSKAPEGEQLELPVRLFATLLDDLKRGRTSN